MGSNPAWGAMSFMDEETLGLVRLLLARLERISADSYWAHRASGIRGALLGILAEDQQIPQDESDQVEDLAEYGFQVLEAAVRDRQNQYAALPRKNSPTLIWEEK